MAASAATDFTEIIYPPLATFNDAEPVIPGPVGLVQEQLWAHFAAEVAALDPEEFKAAAHAAWISEFARGYERKLLKHARPDIRRAGLKLFRIRRDGPAFLAERRAQAERKLAAHQAATADQERELAARRREAAATRELIVTELKLVKEGPGGRLVRRPTRPSSPPPPPANDKLRRPTSEYLAGVESARRTFVRALHQSGLHSELAAAVFRTNLASDGTVADGLRPLTRRDNPHPSVHDVEFCVRAMSYVRAYLRDTGRELNAA